MNRTDNSTLIVNDVTAYGRVSSMAMLPVMTAYGLHPYVLPTAVVSNTMDYGSSVILDTTAFMRDCIVKWREFGFSFRTIATGLINSAEQVDIINDLIDIYRPTLLMVDPIMADDGKIYPGMYEGAVAAYRQLTAKADLIIPNLTEAELLAGIYEGNMVLSMKQLEELIQSLRELGAKSIVITGCKDTDDRTFNLIYDHNNDELLAVTYDKLPYNLVGTGDVFSATLLSELIIGSSLRDAVDRSAQLVRKVVIENRDNTDNYDINIESTIQEAIYEIRQR